MVSLKDTILVLKTGRGGGPWTVVDFGIYIFLQDFNLFTFPLQKIENLRPHLKKKGQLPPRCWACH